MLQISGPGAQAQVEALTALLDAAPALRPQVAEAEWGRQPPLEPDLSDRPGARAAAGHRALGRALIEFARLDGTNRLIGGKVVAFDMRVPSRIYVRCPECRQQELRAKASGEGT
jgi:cell division protein FtsQ